MSSRSAGWYVAACVGDIRDAGNGGRGLSGEEIEDKEATSGGKSAGAGADDGEHVRSGDGAAH